MCVCPSYQRASLNHGPISMDLASHCTFSLHLNYRFGFGFYYFTATNYCSTAPVSFLSYFR